MLTLAKTPTPTFAEAIVYATKLLTRYGDLSALAPMTASNYPDPTAKAVTVKHGAISVDVWFEAQSDGSGFYLYGEY